ncbi:serine/threonine protein kinase, partial [bacterium]
PRRLGERLGVCRELRGQLRRRGDAHAIFEEEDDRARAAHRSEERHERQPHGAAAARRRRSRVLERQRRPDVAVAFGEKHGRRGDGVAAAGDRTRRGTGLLARTRLGNAGFCAPVDDDTFVVRGGSHRLSNPIGHPIALGREGGAHEQTDALAGHVLVGVGEERGSLFIAMEYVEGQSLHSLQTALLRSGKSIPPAMAVRVLCEVLSALHYAHELTDMGGEKLVIVHRDVSPQNVMLTYDGGVKLVDFGVAKASLTSTATEVGTLKGKVRYMAPEQVAGANVDRRADLFAVGVLLWELLAQKRLVRGATDTQALLSLVQDDAPSLLVEAPAVDPGLAAVVMRALNRNPDQRFQTALEMRSALEGFLADAHEHVTSESIGLLVRSTFATERDRMADRVRKAMASSA